MFHKFAAVTALILLCALPSVAQNNGTKKIKVIALTDTKFKYSPADYHISSVIDDRTDTTNIGLVKTGFSDKQTALTLRNGTATSIRQFLAKNMRQNENTTPIELHITTLEVSEKRSDGMDKADIDMGFAFYVGGDKAIELTSSAYVKSGLDATMHIEGMIRQQTESALKQFGEWFAKNKSIVLAGPSVSVEVLIDNNPKDTDYIPYSSTRRLTYDDFRGPPNKLSLGAAETASSVSFSANVLTRGKEVTIKLKVGALFNREESWFKPDQRHPDVLAHEQVHFDITTYMACEFIHAVRNFKFSPDNYEDELQQLKKQSERETVQMQDQYDGETDHGVNIQKQAEWEKKINELMSQQDCFK